jgi:hypothetical protein
MDFRSLSPSSRDFWFGLIWFGLVFLEILKIQRLVWILLWIFFGCFVSITSMFHFDMYKNSLYKMLLDSMDLKIYSLAKKPRL